MQTLEDLKTKELIVGATTPGTATMDFPAIANSVLGLKFKIVPGYEGTAQINTAMERGEVHGNAGLGWVSVKVQNLAWLNEGKIKIPVQWGFERHPDLPNVPTAYGLATTEAQRQALALVFARQEYGRPFFAPPNVPAARVEVLRRAFDATMKDPASSPRRKNSSSRSSRCAARSCRSRWRSWRRPRPRSCSRCATRWRMREEVK